MSDIETLERRIMELESIVTKLQERLRVAGNYQNNDIETRVDAIQHLLVEAAQVKARTRNGRRR